MSTTVTKTFSAVDQASDSLPVTAGQLYSLRLTGTFVATLQAQFSPDNGVSWTPLMPFTTTLSTSVYVAPGRGLIRVYSFAYTSGSPALTAISIDTVIKQIVGEAGNVVLAVTETGIETTAALIDAQAPDLPDDVVARTAQMWIDTAGSGAGGNPALGFGPSASTGARIMEYEEVVSLAAAGAKFKALAHSFPAGCVFLSVQMNLQTLVVAGGTSVKVGLGDHAGVCNIWGNTGTLAKNQKADNIPDWAVLAVDTTPEVCACAAVATGLGDTNFSAGTVRVRITYLKNVSLPNA